MNRSIISSRRRFAMPRIIGSTILLSLLLLIGSTKVSAQQHPHRQLLARGDDLLSEMEKLHLSLSQITQVLSNSNIAQDDEIMSRTAKLIRRVRTLVQANSSEQLEIRRQQEHERLLRVKERQEKRQIRRRREAVRDSYQFQYAEGIAEARNLVEEEQELMEMEWDGASNNNVGGGGERKLDDTLYEDDVVARNLFEQTISFPECKELFLEDCLAVISTEMIDLGMLNYTEVIHEKRNLNQAGYNKVVIITDLSAELVTGKNHDGKVTYPFFWEEVDPATSVISPRMVGVDGKFDCLHLSPEACCAKIQEEVPLPDAKGNYLQCHIFVPYGGVGNNKRDDRVIINLSPDGRVQESPVIE